MTRGANAVTSPTLDSSTEATAPRPLGLRCSERGRKCTRGSPGGGGRLTPSHRGCPSDTLSQARWSTHPPRMFIQPVAVPAHGESRNYKTQTNRDGGRRCLCCRRRQNLERHLPCPHWGPDTAVMGPVHCEPSSSPRPLEESALLLPSPGGCDELRSSGPGALSRVTGAQSSVCNAEGKCSRHDRVTNE